MSKAVKTTEPVNHIAVLTDSPDAYWGKLKQRLNAEGSRAVQSLAGAVAKRQLIRDLCGSKT